MTTLIIIGIILCSIGILVMTMVKIYHFDIKILKESFLESQWDAARGNGWVCRIPFKSTTAIHASNILTWLAVFIIIILCSILLMRL